MAVAVAYTSIAALGARLDCSFIFFFLPYSAHLLAAVIRRLALLVVKSWLDGRTIEDAN